jgi:predicted DCC family thiol-disulfide oxidoreductase YuxK
VSHEIEVFFDGDCPLCVREMRFFTRLDAKRGRIRFIDIMSPDFDESALGIDWPTFMQRIHARLPDGSWITGVEVFRRLYTAVGWGVLVWPTRLPGVSRLLDFAYEKFAKNRFRMTGRCSSESCELPERHTRAKAASGMSSALLSPAANILAEPTTPGST